MIPLLVLCAATAVARAAGSAGIDPLDGCPAAVRLGLAVMLVLTASAHFSSRRKDLIRMVPPQLPKPAVLVTVTGIAELAIAAALLLAPTAQPAAVVLAALLVAMFPANVHAARAGIPLGGRPPTPLLPRSLIQLVFLGSAAVVIAGGQS